MKTKLSMLSTLQVGSNFCMTDNGQTYMLIAKCTPGPDSMAALFICRNSTPNSQFTRPFVVEGDRPVMLILTD